MLQWDMIIKWLLARIKSNDYIIHIAIACVEMEKRGNASTVENITYLNI